MLDTLHILHLKFTGIEKTDLVCTKRYELLMEELKTQGISDYKIWDGIYNPDNTKQAIHLGHRQIVQYAKDNNLPRVVISEDDIRFTHPNSYNYFLSQIPESYDLFCGLVYSAEMQGDRVMNGASGIMTLFVVNERFYDFFLSMDTNNHVDREAGLTAFKHEYYVCQPMMVEQRGGYSHNLRQQMFYDTYLEGKKLYEG